MKNLSLTSAPAGAGARAPEQPLGAGLRLFDDGGGRLPALELVHVSGSPREGT